MIAKLLSGLPDELRYAVRTDMQQEFPKEGGIYRGTVKDFVRIPKLHSMQTGVDDMTATAKFREKLPNYLRSNQLIASSTESGLKLVSLAQRIMNRCNVSSHRV